MRDGNRSGVTVVVATRNRADELSRTLAHLTALPERPRVIVVDNASADGTPVRVRARHPEVAVICLRRNSGAWARTVGAVHARTSYVAFSDDDSWWLPGSLRRAARLLDAHPCLGLVAGRTLVGPAAAEDPINAELAASPLGPRRPGGPGSGGSLPGPRVLGFLGCAAVARRDAFLAVGGYGQLLRIGGEERWLAADLAAAGWDAVYAADVVARHCPSAARDAHTRRRTIARNDVLFAWLRRPPRVAAARTLALAREASRNPDAARALIWLVRVLPRSLAARRPLPRQVEADLRLLEQPAPRPAGEAHGGA